MLTSGKLEHTKTAKYSLAADLTHWTQTCSKSPTKGKETREGMTQESLMMNLNKSLPSLNYPEPNVYKTH